MATRRPNYYRLLGVSADASVVEIRAAFRRAAKAAHPDAGGDPETFRRLREAHDTLTDPPSRRSYDAEQGIVAPPAGATGPETGGWSGTKGDFTGDVEFPAWMRSFTDAPWEAPAATEAEHGEDRTVVLGEAPRAWWWPSHATQPPVAAGELCLFSSADALACCEAATGRQVWQVRLGRAIAAPPTVRGARVGVVTSDGTLHGLELRSGLTVWETPLGAPPAGGLAAAGGMLVAGAERRLVGIDAASGRRLWASKLAAEPTRVTASATEVIVSTDADTLHCIETGKGRSVWWLRSANMAPVAPLTVGPSLWLATGAGELLRLERSTGAAMVSVRAGATVTGMVTDGALVAAAVAGPAGVLAVPPSGQPRWSRELPAVTEAPAFDPARNLLHLVDNDGALRSFSMADGTEILAAPIPFRTAGAPVAAGGHVLVADTDGAVWALAVPGS